MLSCYSFSLDRLGIRSGIPQLLKYFVDGFDNIPNLGPKRRDSPL